MFLWIHSTSVRKHILTGVGISYFLKSILQGVFLPLYTPSSSNITLLPVYLFYISLDVPSQTQPWSTHVCPPSSRLHLNELKPKLITFPSRRCTSYNGQNRSSNHHLASYHLLRILWIASPCILISGCEYVEREQHEISSMDPVVDIDDHQHQ